MMASFQQTVKIDEYRLAEGAADVSFFEMSPPMYTLPQSPSFMLGTIPASDTAEMFGRTQTGPAGYYVIHNAVLTVDGITLHNGNMLTSAVTNFPEAHCLMMVRNVSAAVLAAPARKLAGRAVLMTGPGFTTWGHWLVDFLPRLFLIEQAGWQLDRLTWIITKQTPSFARELLLLAGLPESCLAEYDPSVETLGVDELIIPTNLSAGPLLHPLFNEAVIWLKRKFHNAIIGAASRQSNLFLTRSGNPLNRMLRNRDVIETIARAARYTLVDPASLPVADQLGLFYSANRIVGEYGSGLHTSIFAPVGSIVLCLRGPRHIAGVLQNGLAKACGQKIAYVFGDALSDGASDAYEVSPEAFRLALEYAELAAR